MGSATSVLRRPWTKAKCKDLFVNVRLPQEIIDMIFIFAASTSKNTSLALSSVSRSSRRLVIPILFESLTLDHRAGTYNPDETLWANPAIAPVIKSLWIRECTPREVELIALCTSLERLAVTPQAFSTLCGFGNTVWRQHGHGTLKLALPHELHLFPGVVDWGMRSGEGSGVAADGPYSASLLANLTHLHLAQASQFISLQTIPLPLLSLTQLATPFSGTSLCPRDIIGSYRFPNLRLISVLPRPSNDPGLSFDCQFAALQWKADGLANTPEKDGRVNFVDEADVSDARLLEDWKTKRSRLQVASHCC